MVRSSRRELTWVEDDKIDKLVYREPAVAVGFGVVSGGGGYLYTGDFAKGAAGIGAMVLAVGLAAVLPIGLGILPIAAVAGWGGFGGFKRAKAINRYIANNLHTNLALTHTSGTQNLLGAMDPSSARNPKPLGSAPFTGAAGIVTSGGEHAELREQLSKLASIRAAGVIDENEHQSRKIDLLSEHGTGLDPRATEAFLFELLPLLDAGILNEEDLQFAKDLGQ